MDELVRLLEEITHQFLNEMEEADYLAVEQFVEQREGIIARIKDCSLNEPFLDKHKIVVNRLLQHDAHIIRKMAFLRNEASLKLKNFQQAGTQRNAYDTDHVAESHFFDMRK